MKVFWTVQAQLTFEQNIAYLQKEWNADVINNFLDKTDKAIQLIAKNPLLFPLLNKKKQIHQCVVIKQITLYYRIANNQVQLLTFWNNYQNPKKLKL